MRYIIRFVTFTVWVLLTLILVGCSAPSTVTTISTSNSTPSTVTATSTITTAPTYSPSPIISTIQSSQSGTVLDPAPQSCPSNSKLEPSIIGGYTYFIGGYPLWAGSFADAPITLPYSTYVVKYDTQYGWGYKLLWVMDPAYMRSVTVRGGSLTDNAPLWFSIGGIPISKTPTFEAKRGLETQKGARDFPSRLYVPKAGCYFIEAYSDTGEKLWRVEFAAGARTG